MITTVGETSEANHSAGAGSHAVAGSAGSANGQAGTNGTLDAGANGGAGVGATVPIPSDDGKCTFDVLADAQQRPLEIYILLDSNLSLAIGLWELAAQGVRNFANDPRSAGTYVGLRLYGSECSPAEYQKPTVPVGLLPGSAPTIAEGTRNQDFIQSSQMWPALQGGIAFEGERNKTFPDRKHSVVLITDGFSQDLNLTCPLYGTDDVVAAAAFGATQIPPVETHVISFEAPAGFDLVADFQKLDEVAAAGKTDKRIEVAAQNVTGGTADALHTVRRRAQTCEFVLPRSADITRVSLALAPNSGSGELPLMNEQAACGNKDGWYFDDPVRPTRMMLCPHTCTTLRSDDAHSITPLTGCKPKKG